MITKVNMICIAALCLLFTANISVEAQVPGYVPTDGLVGWYPLNGTGEDMSELMNNLAMEGTVPTTDRWSTESGAMAFDGGATMSNLTFNGIGINVSHTVVFWEKHSAAESGIILSQRTGSSTTGNKLHYGYRGANDGPCTDGGCMAMDFYAVQHITSFTSELESWNHWVLIYDSTTLNSQIFLNGQLVSDQIMAQPWGGSFDEGISLGAYAQTDNDINHFIGAMDDLGIWNRTLTEEEIMALYQSQISGCTDETACNYNADATEDDGSCVFPPVIDLGEDIETCEESVILDAGPGFDSYLWSTGETTQTIEVSESGDYSVEVGNASLENDFSMSFDGNDDYIDFSIATTGLDEQGVISVAFKIQSDVLHPILDGFANPSYALFNFDNGIQDPLVVRIGSGCYANSATITLEDDDCGQSNPSVRAYWGNDSYLLYDDQWHEITLVSNEGGHTLYLDGDEVNLTYTLGDNSVNIWPSDATQFEIGTDLNGDINFQGLLDEVTLWSTTISQLDIQQYIQCPPTGGEEGLVGYWNFSEGSGTTAIDLSGNGNDGVINGAVFSEDVPETNCPNCTSSDTISVTFLSSGCTDPTACNYNEEAGCDDGLCVFPVGCDTCSGEQDGTGTVVDNDADDDGVCDDDEIVGCQDDQACNYNIAATDAGTCIYPEGFCDTCSGETDGTGVVVDNDADDDGVCDDDEIVGCQDDQACNYNASATDAGTCIYPEGICDTCSGETDGTGVVVDNDADDDGVCDDDEIVGCQDPDACNYDPLATDEGECEYVTLSVIEGNVTPVLFETTPYTCTFTEGSTYQWTVEPGVISSGQESAEVQVVWSEIGSGEICVIETTSTGCVGAEVCMNIAIIPTGIEEVNASQFSIYPNPASTSITISTNAALLNSPYRITDAQGKLVMEGALRNTTTVLNTDHLSNGQYTLAIISDEAVITKPLIIRK